MKELLGAAAMKEADRRTIQNIGVPSLVLMERAALSVFEEIKKRRQGQIKALVFAGTGNNGADGLAVARMLKLAGDDVRVTVTGNRAHATEEWLTQYKILQKLNVPVTPELPDREQLHMEHTDLIVDAMLGIGLMRDLQGKTAAAVRLINDSGAFVCAVDIPTGINADSGAVMGSAVKADLTVTFAYKKIGHVLFPGTEYSGETVVSDIGILPLLQDSKDQRVFALEEEDLDVLKKRPADGHKGTFGRVLVVAGSFDMAGAAVLSGSAAYRSGAGLVQILSPECNRLILQTSVPEAILTSYKDNEFSPEKMDAMLNAASSVVIGPGLGICEQSRRFLRYIIQYSKKPVVIDADGLNMLAEKKALMDQLTPNHILTPHMGEMSRLTGKDIAEIKADPVKAAADFVARFPVTLVLKDARTVIASSAGSDICINTCGNSGMATGGSGDVLSGVIGGLLAQKFNPSRAACLGVLMHACAGDRAAAKLGERAVTAGEILRSL